MPPKNNKKFPPVAKLALVAVVDLTVTITTTGTQAGATGKNRRTATASTLASWRLYWGDGTSESGAGAPPVTRTHTYANPTTSAIIQLVVTDTNTLTASATLTVTPDNPVIDPTPTPATPPAVLSITRMDASPTSAAQVRWQVAFTEAVQGPAAGNFTLAASGVSGAVIALVSGQDAVWVVTVLTGVTATVGTLGLTLSATGGITSVASGLTLSNTLVGQVYSTAAPAPDPPDPPTSDPPAVVSITRMDASPVTTPAQIRWQVTFSEPVQGVTLSSFSLATLGITGASLALISGQNAIYVLTALTGTTTTQGTIRLDLSTTTGITAISSGLALSNTLTGEVYTAVAPPPIVPDPPIIPPSTEDFGNFRPQVQGEYSQVTGGRGGSLYRVTHNNVDGSVGSINWACSQSNGVVIFDVGGPFYLTAATGSLNISGSNLTIAGQTAPRDGVFIIYSGNWGAYVEAIVTGSNVIVQHVTVLGGNICSNGLFAYLTADVIFDHVTQLWHQDEGLAAYGDRIAFWRCISGEGLNQPPEATSCAQAGYSDVSHGMFIAGTIVSTDITAAQCLLVSNYYRNPAFGDCQFRFMNSLVYNWSYRAWAGAPTANIGAQQAGVGVRFIPGPGNVPDYPYCIAIEGDVVASGPSRIYLDDCTFESNGFLPSPRLFYSGVGYTTLTGTPPISIANYTSPAASADLEAFLLPRVGARPSSAYRDYQTGTRIVNYITNRQGPMPGTGNNSYPVYSSDVGGPPNISPTVANPVYADPASPNTVVGPFGRTNRDLTLESLAILVET